MAEQPKKPDVADIDLRELPVVGFPALHHADRLRVHLEPSVHAAMVAHALENDRIELCGVMLGCLYRDEQGPFLCVTAAIRGEHAGNQSAQVTFTQETWAHIHREMDRRYSGMQMVGWYHTHPGFGIFLSSMDLFIHENFFNSPEQVAFVIDPQSGDEGFFCWREGKVVRMRHFWVGDQEWSADVVATAASGSLDRRVESLQSQVDFLIRTQKHTRLHLRALLVGLLLLAAGMAVSRWPQIRPTKLFQDVGREIIDLKEIFSGGRQDKNQPRGSESTRSGREAGAGAPASGSNGPPATETIH